MKKFLFSALMLLGLSIAASAQTKVIWDGYPDLEFKVKRCYVRGTTCFVDVLVINNTGKNLNGQICIYSETEVCAYDDEGNIYPSNKYNQSGIYDESAKYIDGTLGTAPFGGYPGAGSKVVGIPSDTSIKLQFRIHNFDEFATVITSLICKKTSGFNDRNYGLADLQIKNIPVTRD